jgi:hypothetical protein
MWQWRSFKMSKRVGLYIGLAISLSSMGLAQAGPFTEVIRGGGGPTFEITNDPNVALGDAFVLDFNVTEFGSPAPELSTWRMMILGFAGIGFMACRRRKRTAALFVA